MPAVGAPRTAARALHLAAVFAQRGVTFQALQLRHPRALTVPERAMWLHHSARQALRSMRVEVIAQGAPPASGLLVSNHLSYLDVLVYASLFPCLFVAKQEVRRWAVFGAYATMAGTIYVDRERTAQNRPASEAMERALDSGVPVVLFPEGTSTDGSRPLPFRSPFFQPAVTSGASVHCAAASYQSDSAPERDLAYCGDAIFLPHLLQTLSQRRVRARVCFATAAQHYTDRKQAARCTQQQVEELRRGMSRGSESQVSASQLVHAG